ncbi:protein ANKUB1-like [Megalops cyprinoides]|uniref:protein ANKUB1-like n=1 Tax=Megalops cyprinoides TaxID=118141 RepID=UPI001864E09D|nr:protein ANKUB1-like [Megalops cyprinoides]
MRIFIAFEGSCEPFDISQDQTVRTIKWMIKDFFHMQLSDDKRTHRFIDLTYAGATLQDSWVLPDVGIAPSSTIHCVLKEEDKPILHVFSAVTKETLSVMGTVFLLSTSVSKLKSLVSLQNGLPVSTFRLTTQTGLELYNCNCLDEYGIEVGTTLHLDTWDGWTEFLRGCFLGHRHTVQHYLSEEEPVMRFQQRVALYVAAFFGHLDLADWLLRRGVRAEEAVGVHPYREWCKETDHPEVSKCPVHAAAEAGQLHILKFFINNSVLNLNCRDHRGRSPLQITIQHRHRDCVQYLITKLWSMVSFPGLSFPMGTYIQIKRWVHKAQRQASPVSMVHKEPYKTRVGDTVLVDGFTLPEMTSKPRSRVTRAGAAVQCSNLPVRGQPGQLPQLHPAAVDDGRLRRSGRQEGRSKREEILSAENRDQNRNTWRSKVPLPPISQDTNPRPRFIYASPNSSLILTSSLESFSKHCGRSTRENAIYCLALASAFTEKPWLQQLGMARTLAQRTVQKLV